MAVVAAVLFLSALGYPVASLIAGLGIGGLALALASQKTVENLFGAFSLGIDQPFREGDFVRVEDWSGQWSPSGCARPRSEPGSDSGLDPNGKLAEMRLETFAVRDRLRLACMIGLVYGTTAEQMRKVLGGSKGPASASQDLAGTVIVRLKELAASSLDIEVRPGSRLVTGRSSWYSPGDALSFMQRRRAVRHELRVSHPDRSRGSAGHWMTLTFLALGVGVSQVLQSGCHGFQHGLGRGDALLRHLGKRLGHRGLDRSFALLVEPNTAARELQQRATAIERIAFTPEWSSASSRRRSIPVSELG